MAHLHFKRTVYRSGGAAARGRLEYITRHPVRELTTEQQQVRYIADDREDLVSTNSRNLPVWAKGNPHTFFKAAERYEFRVSNVAFEEWKVTLPQALSRDQNLALTHDLVETIAGSRLPITYAFHEPKTLDGTRQQPHLHFLISGRQVDQYVRTPVQHFRRWNAQHPERGGARKDPAFWERGAVKKHRVLIADVINLHLERAGVQERVHPDSLERQQLDRAPEPKLLPSESRAYREHGVISTTMQAVFDIRAQRTGQWEREQTSARAYWEDRREQLGLERGMPPEQALLQIRQARTEERPMTRERQKAQELTRQSQGGHDLDRRWERPLIGNTNSGIYHTSEHKNYGDVRPAYQVRFWTEREAIAAGFRRAMNDHYGRGTGVAREESAVQQRVQILQGYRERLHQARQVVMTYERRGVEPPLSVQQGTERVLADARRHGLPPDLHAERAIRESHPHRFVEELVMPTEREEQGGGRAARVRIWDERRQNHEEEGRHERV